VVSAPRVVIVGGGHAGFHAAIFLRSGSWPGEVTVIDAQAQPPYQRPPLSKDFLAGKQELADGEFRPASFYPEHGIELITGERVAAIDRTARTVAFAGRAPIRYDELVLATGSRPRALPVPGAELDGVQFLVTRDDAAALRERLTTAERIVVIGGGFIGLETAAVAATAGKRVTIFEAADRLMVRGVSEPMSRYFEELHRSHGSRVVLSSPVAAIEGAGGRVRAVVTADGTREKADLVITGIGVVPNDDLAANAGLVTGDGILVDAGLRTSDARIFAIGDCARFSTRYAADVPSVRLESVQNATDQARFLAQRLHDGFTAAAYDAVPWFWTEQFGRRLQIAGLTSGFDRFDQVFAGDGQFSIFCYRGETLLGCESVNSPRDHMRARRTLAAVEAPVAPRP